MPDRPYVTLNVAMTVDGKTDTIARKGAAISSAIDRERVDRLRAESDAVIVGGHTLLGDDPSLTVKSEILRANRLSRGLEENPIKVGIVTNASLRLDSRFMTIGKALARKATEIAIVFQQPPHLMFSMPADRDFTPNILSICIQPNEGIHLRFEAKQPGSDDQLRSVEMDFHYRDSFGDGLPEAYEKLLLEALEGDASLFTRSDAIEASWKLIDPVLQLRENSGQAALESYEPGSWGPASADALLAQGERAWLLNCGEHASS
jgi:hypothetical protein